MVIILCEYDTQSVAQAISDDLVQAYDNQVQAEILSAGSDIKETAEHSWNDLLVVIFKNNEFPEITKKFIQQYQQAANSQGFILPISVNPQYNMPPEPISSIKAIPYNDETRGISGLILKRIGVILGLRLRHRDMKIFISYRMADGNHIAEQLFQFLKEKGFNPWLDKAKDEHDNNPNIQGGQDVKAVIEKNLKKANLILLIDTPKVTESRWIKQEIDTALAQNVPIIPACLRIKEDQLKGTRFRSLRDLQRWVEIKLPETAFSLKNSNPLEDFNLEKIMNEIEIYLLAICKRTFRIKHNVSNCFASYGFNWNELDSEKNLYNSVRQQNMRVRNQILWHCSIFDPVYMPALKGFIRYIRESNFGISSNFRLFIHDGEILSDLELEDIYKEQNLYESGNPIILHHQELPVLLESNFTRI